MSILVTEGLKKAYGKRLAIEDLDLRLSEGEIFGFLGPNGSGKTTTIRILLGLLRPTAGRARIFDRDCWHDHVEVKRDLGYLPGDLRLYPEMTGRSALEILGRIRRRDLGRAGRELAERFDLELGLRASSMSRGTRQKLGLLLALVHRPRLVILDEPSASLDPLMQERLAAFLRELAREGRTIFLSTHSLLEVEHVCERVAILREGRVVEDATLEELRARVRREAIIRWDEEPGPKTPGLPPGVELLERQRDTWRCAFQGSAAPLIRWLEGLKVADLSLAPPNLDEIFGGYYRG